MKKWIALYAATVLALASTLAFGQLTSTGAGRKATAAATYTGPADIVASPTAWYGLRAMSAADRGNKLLNVCNVADVVCADFSSDATTGALVISTVGGSSCSIVTCTIKTMYDRSGSGQDATMAVIANRPTLTVSCVNSLPCAAFNGTAQRLSGSISSISSPQTMAGVVTRTGNTSSLQVIFIASNLYGFLNATNTARLFNGATSVTATISDSNWHSYVGVLNGASSVIAIDGVDTTGNLGATSATGTSFGIGGLTTGGQQFSGNLTETGMWPVAFSAGNRTSMCHNQFTYWGTSVSC